MVATKKKLIQGTVPKATKQGREQIRRDILPSIKKKSPVRKVVSTRPALKRLYDPPSNRLQMFTEGNLNPARSAKKAVSYKEPKTPATPKKKTVYDWTPVTPWENLYSPLLVKGEKWKLAKLNKAHRPPISESSVVLPSPEMVYTSAPRKTGPKADYPRTMTAEEQEAADLARNASRVVTQVKKKRAAGPPRGGGGGRGRGGRPRAADPPYRGSPGPAIVPYQRLYEGGPWTVARKKYNTRRK